MNKMYEELKKIIEMCQYIEDNPNDTDKISMYQQVIPKRILRIKDDLLTMFE